MLERLNPVLVKEVRQALRGKTFRISLALTLVAATVASTILILAQDPDAALDSGVQYLTSIYVCLAVALLGVVPFSAFQSMGAEWEESTYDLLVLSDLRPRRIVIGKWLSSFVLALLFVAAFLPYLTFAFLLRGVDLVALGVLVVGTLLVSGVLSASAIAISSSSPTRFVRMMLVVALASGLLSLVPMASALAYQLLTNAGLLADPDLQMVIAWLGLAGVLSVAMSVAIACSRLAHPEENRSSGLRVIGSLGIVAGLAATAHLYLRSGQPVSALALALMLLVSLFVGGAWLCVEPLPLGRRVRKQVPRSTALGLLATPWLPGGARGFAYVVAHAALVLGCLALLLRWEPATSSGRLAFGPNAGQVTTILVVVVLYGVIYLGAPLLFFSRGLARPGVRRGAIAAIFAFAACAALLPSIYGLVTGDRALQEGRHLGLPAFLLEQIDDQSSGLSPRAWQNLLSVALAAAVVLLLHLPRCAAAYAEVARASRERRRA
jgi:ABC-type transport system involved in multi-copper enzyme maturation permease subunit